MNQGIYNSDRLKIGFILSNFPTLVTFLADIQLAFCAADWVKDVVNRLKTLKQGKKTAEELVAKFWQIVGQAEMERKSKSDHLHLIGYF
jgi:hypothetical protein